MADFRTFAFRSTCTVIGIHAFAVAADFSFRAFRIARAIIAIDTLAIFANFISGACRIAGSVVTVDALSINARLMLIALRNTAFILQIHTGIIYADLMECAGGIAVSAVNTSSVDTYLIRVACRIAGFSGYALTIVTNFTLRASFIAIVCLTTDACTINANFIILTERIACRRGDANTGAALVLAETGITSLTGYLTITFGRQTHAIDANVSGAAGWQTFIRICTHTIDADLKHIACRFTGLFAIGEAYSVNADAFAITIRGT